MADGYCWVVTCKNARLHQEKNPFAGHRIPLGRTDAYSPRPPLPDTLDVRCDDLDCRKSYSYEREEVIRWFGDVAAFLPHPTFG